MNSLRDQVLLTTAIVALALGAFVGGWWMGRAGAALDTQDARIAALEQRVALAQAGAARAERPEPPAPQVPPARPAAPANVEVEVGDSPARGPADAPVTLVAFSDFECPFCARVTPTLTQLEEEYGDRLRVVFKHFPLPMHARAMDAHKAAVAAGEQGRFWEMHDRIFAAPQSLDPASLRAHAEAIGLDMAAYDAAVASPETEARIRGDLAQGQQAGVRGTPSFVVNGRLFSGALPYEAFKAQVDQALAQAEAPAGAAAGGAGR